MIELQQKAILAYNSKWTQIYPIIRQDERFTNMLQQPGSTPLDIFKFHVHDLKLAYNKDRKRVRKIMHNLDLKVTLEMPFSDFREKVRAEDPKNEIDATNLELYFKAQLDKCSSGDENDKSEDEMETTAEESRPNSREDGELDDTMEVDQKQSSKKSKKKHKKDKKEKKAKKKSKEKKEKRRDRD